MRNQKKLAASWSTYGSFGRWCLQQWLVCRSWGGERPQRCSRQQQPGVNLQANVISKRQQCLCNYSHCQRGERKVPHCCLNLKFVKLLSWLFGLVEDDIICSRAECWAEPFLSLRLCVCSLTCCTSFIALCRVLCFPALLLYYYFPLSRLLFWLQPSWYPVIHSLLFWNKNPVKPERSEVKEALHKSSYVRSLHVCDVTKGVAVFLASGGFQCCFSMPL